MIKVKILLHSEYEDGINPEFTFEDEDSAFSFIRFCFKNDYCELEISNVDPRE